MSIIAQGNEAPSFTAQLGDGNLLRTKENTFDLASKRGINIVLAFYPADWSPVCSNQIAIYSQLIPAFKELNAEVYGISVDGSFCHAAFKEAHNMSIPLICDFEPKGAISKLYSVYNNEMGISERAIYVIDAEGIIQYSYLSPMGENPGAKEILETLKKIQHV